MPEKAWNDLKGYKEEYKGYRILAWKGDYRGPGGAYIYKGNKYLVYVFPKWSASLKAAIKEAKLYIRTVLRNQKFYDSCTTQQKKKIDSLLKQRVSAIKKMNQARKFLGPGQDSHYNLYLHYSSEEREILLRLQNLGIDYPFKGEYCQLESKEK